MKKHILGAICLTMGLISTNATTVNYTADNNTIFRNPERGFTEEISGKVSDSKNHLLVGEEDFFDETGVNSETGYPVARPSETLIVLLYNLYNYKAKDLSAKMLQGFDDDMQVLRNKGFKCVLRFAYTEDEGDKNDATLAWAQRHISQLKPHLIANADVIYVIEAGFVGVWGEWYYTNNYGNQSQSLNANRRALLDTLMKSTPQDRFVLVRYPLIKTQFLGDENALTATQAFSGSIRARMGHHNDAFLNAWGDMGTYGRDGNGPDDDPILRQYISDETLYVPNGGETNVEDDDDDFPNLSQQVYNKAEAQMSLYHWSFCGESYAVQVTNKWRASGIFDNLNRKMGYRYQMVSATLPDQTTVGGTATINLQIKNVGYAPLYNERHAYIVFKNSSNTYPIQLQSDPRRWLPNDVVTTINEQLALPSNMPAGTYQLYLHLPDKYTSLASDPRFAIRFANANVWDATTGMNKLFITATVADGAVTFAADDSGQGGGDGGDDPTPPTPPTPGTQGQYSVRTFNTDSTVCTWNFQNVVTTDATINTEAIDNDIIFRPADGGKIKVLAGASNGLSSQKTQSTLCIPVPAASAGTIEATMYGSSDSRWFQLYVDGTAASTDKRIWSKYNATATSDGKKGPQSFTFTASDLTQIGGNYYLVLTDNGTEMKVVSFTVTLTTGSYAVGNGGSQGGGDDPTPPTPPTPSGDAIQLPATLNKANVDAVSSDMTYYSTDYFDFGSTDAENTGRWAEWKVYLRYPGQYIISVVNGFPGDDNADGNTWQLQLLNGSNVVSTYLAENLWAEAQYTYSAKWDLRSVAVGEYKLRVMNTAAWEQPKLQSVTLQYDGILPTALEEIGFDATAPAYDILGRPVDETYHGVVIQNGKRYIR